MPMNHTTHPRRLARAVAAACSAVALAGGLAACGDDGTSTTEAAQDSGYRSGDGTLSLIPPKERAEPVDLAGTTLSGKTWDAADHRGQVVVVNLWASWCGPCEEEAPELIAAEKAAPDPKVEFVGIDYREPSKDTGRAHAEAWGLTYPSIFDKSGQSAIEMQGKLSTQPSTAVLDPKGRIAAVKLGPITESTLTGIIEDTLAESDG